MSRPTRIDIDTSALAHNVRRVKQCAPGKKIIAMVKANAYGCGLPVVLPILEPAVDAFGVACLQEALAVRALGSERDCILFQGIFSPDELPLLADKNLQCVIHQQHQLNWILTSPQPKKIKVWLKINTGMNRLGIACHEMNDMITALSDCPWVDNDIGLMTHLACSDDLHHESNQKQLQIFNHLPNFECISERSMANSAAILTQPDMHFDAVRPGIMLYGISPFAHQIGQHYDLKPVMRFVSAITAIQRYAPSTPIGYGATWQSEQASVIGLVSVGYGDGYPRHIAPGTLVWVNGDVVPIVGRVSMDMITVDLTNCRSKAVGDPVELWGEHIPIETVAKQAGTIAYELICQITQRVRI